VNGVMRDRFGLSKPMQHIMRLQLACMNPHSKILKHTVGGCTLQTVLYTYPLYAPL